MRGGLYLTLLAVAVVLTVIGEAIPDLPQDQTLVVPEVDSFLEEDPYQFEDTLLLERVAREHKTQTALVGTAIQNQKKLVEEAVQEAVHKQMIDTAVHTAATKAIKKAVVAKAVKEAVNAAQDASEPPEPPPKVGKALVGSIDVPPPLGHHAPNKFHTHHHDCKFACPVKCLKEAKNAKTQALATCKACADCKNHLDHGKGLIEAVAQAHEDETADIKEENLKTIKKVHAARRAAAAAVAKFAKLPVGKKKEARLAKAKEEGLSPLAAQKKEALHREHKTARALKKAAVMAHQAKAEIKQIRLGYAAAVKGNQEAHSEELAYSKAAAKAKKAEFYAKERLRTAGEHPDPRVFSKWGGDKLLSKMHKAVDDDEASHAVKAEARIALDNVTGALHRQEKLVEHTQELENEAEHHAKHLSKEVSAADAHRHKVLNAETRAALDAEAETLSFRGVRPPTPEERAGIAGEPIMEGTWYDSTNDAVRQRAEVRKHHQNTNMLSAKIRMDVTLAESLRSTEADWDRKSEALGSEESKEVRLASELREDAGNATKLLRKATQTARTSDLILKKTEMEEVIAVMKDAKSLNRPIKHASKALKRVRLQTNATLKAMSHRVRQERHHNAHQMTKLGKEDQTLGKEFKSAMAKAMREEKRAGRTKKAMAAVGEIVGALDGMKEASKQEALTAEEEVANAQKEKGFAYQVARRAMLKHLHGRSKAANATVAMLQDVKTAALAKVELAKAKHEMKDVMRIFRKAAAADGLAKLRMARAAQGQYIPQGRLHLEEADLPGMIRKPTESDVHRIEIVEEKAGLVMNHAEEMRHNSSEALAELQEVEDEWADRAKHDVKFKAALKKYETAQKERRAKLTEKSQQFANKAEERSYKAKVRAAKHLMGADEAYGSIMTEEKRLKMKEKLRFLQTAAGQKLWKAIGEKASAVHTHLLTEKLHEKTAQLVLKKTQEEGEMEVESSLANEEGLEARREEDASFITHLKEDLQKFHDPNPPMPPLNHGVKYHIHEGKEGDTDKKFAQIAQPHAAHGDTDPEEQVGAVEDGKDYNAAPVVASPAQSATAEQESSVEMNLLQWSIRPPPVQEEASGESDITLQKLVESYTQVQ